MIYDIVYSQYVQVPIKKNTVIIEVAEGSRDSNGKRYSNLTRVVGMITNTTGIPTSHTHTHTHTHTHVQIPLVNTAMSLSRGAADRGCVCVIYECLLYLLSSVFHPCLRTFWHYHPYFLLQLATRIFFFFIMTLGFSYYK